MKLLDIQAAIGTAILLLSLPCEAKHGHSLAHMDVLGKRHSHRRLQASPKVERIEAGLKKRGTCAFPSDAGLVAVTPGSKNAGWAMSPDQECTPGSWCPYACPPGQVMAQWNPKATSYTYPMSLDGGLYCNSNGQVSKPFPNKDYCVDGTGAVGAQNNCGKVVSFCQTVLPGNEAMLIPTQVDDWSQLAVPDPSYWASTAAHFYINPPGIPPEDACIWSDGSKPLGNWSPYVAGANTDGSGNTYAKIAWNPVWQDSNLKGTMPSFGIKIVCSGGDCNGTPCSIDPSSDGIGGVTSSDQSSGDGAKFCVVTVPKGVTANVVVFNVGDSEGGSGGKPSSSSKSQTPSPTPTPKPTPKPKPSTTSTTSSSSTTSSTTSTSTSTSSTSTTKSKPSITLLPTSSNSTTSHPPSNSPHILFENTNTTAAASYYASGTGNAVTTTQGASPIASPTKKSLASETHISGSMFSFLVVFAAAAYLL